ncbi:MULTISPECIES: hypothetical protein [unclassified Methylobacterium]|jgi:hypothetical protein|uniref:hypothetical protein n=1 Tax=unclassified Methylobacterium TaxID=2615210 RepID=UPI001353308E|nr:hypothetical protein [Methylobacterium sp. 2A]MWV22009.1 hypothetical protein [Methylobacterium sp. 2A]
MTQDQPVTDVLPLDLGCLSDTQLIVLIALKRLPFEHEVWSSEGVLCTKLALRALNETLMLNAPTGTTVHPALDKSVRIDESVLRRLYRICLNRSPTDAELRRWLELGVVSTNALCENLLYSFESYRCDAVTVASTGDDFRRQRKTYICTELLDQFALRQGHGVRLKTKSEIASRVAESRHVKVAINSFGLSEADRNYISSRLFNRFGVEVLIKSINVEEILENDALKGFDIFITGNNNLYDRLDDQLQRISSTPAISAVWLWDNHHQYDLSTRCAQNFDIVFPAHSNGHSYLHGEQAVIGAVVPCCVVQWSYDEACHLFHKYIGTERSNALYGRFNSYPGRNAMRDEFLRSVNREVSANVEVISADKNDWHRRGIDDRFLELQGNKVILCNTIFNDVPARLFDAALVGAVPIVPYGLADMRQSFTDTEMFDLPIVQYIPGDLQSLREAIDEAVFQFDLGGRSSMVRRFLTIAENHLFRNRVERMLAEIFVLLNIRSLTVAQRGGGQSGRLV